MSNGISTGSGGSLVQFFTRARNLKWWRGSRKAGSPAEHFEIFSQWQINARAEELKPLLSNPMSILQWWSSVFVEGEMLSSAHCKDFKARFFTKGFLPHTFQFVAWIEEESDNEITIKTDGDFGGVGKIRLHERHSVSIIDVRWSVTVKHPYIWPFLRVLKPVFVWNHLWAMSQGRKGLEAYMGQTGAQGFVQPKPTFPHNLDYFSKPRHWRV